MTTSIPHDPMLKATTRDRLYALLYVPADTQLFERLKAIIVRNAVKIGASHASFMYRAVNYRSDQNPILPRPRNQLHVSLEPLMQEYLADQAELATEKPHLQAYLTQVLNASDHPADWLLLLPSALHPPVKLLLEEKTFNDKRLAPEAIELFLVKNKTAISMTKQRLVTNLITT